MCDKNKIMILCKVVDNFGDIGVVYRLARALSDLRAGLELTLVVSNLESFHKMARQIDPEKTVQDFKYKNSTWKIIDWNLTQSPVSTEDFSIILECFQCGRPDWLEDLLFADDFTRTVQIIQIDYLTAEDYADEFHLLKSGTRKANIKKIFFMPGFTDKTAGLIINKIENGGVAGVSHAEGVAEDSEAGWNEGETSPISTPNSSLLTPHFSIFFFAYEDDCTSVVKGISDFQEKMRERKPEFSVTVFAAEGKSCAPFEKSWKKAGTPFKLEKVPFMQQEEFDYFITQMDFLFVRGEDSLARAALTGLPYIWQAYKQDENYQLVKVNALLERMRPYFDPQDFSPVEGFWQNYNDYEKATESEALTQMLCDSASQKNTGGFKDFARKLHENGNLAEALLNYIGTLSI